MNNFICGIILALYAVAALFFFRFWKKTGDRLLLLFGLGLTVLGAERLVLLLTPQASEYRHFVYLIRLSAFLLFLMGIVDKNRLKN